MSDSLFPPCSSPTAFAGGRNDWSRAARSFDDIAREVPALSAWWDRLVGLSPDIAERVEDVRVYPLSVRPWLRGYRCACGAHHQDGAHPRHLFRHRRLAWTPETFAAALAEALWYGRAVGSTELVECASALRHAVEVGHPGFVRHIERTLPARW